jgi:hypothetical protein
VGGVAKAHDRLRSEEAVEEPEVPAVHHLAEEQLVLRTVRSLT